MSVLTFLEANSSRMNLTKASTSAGFGAAIQKPRTGSSSTAVGWAIASNIATVATRHVNIERVKSLIFWSGQVFQKAQYNSTGIKFKTNVMYINGCGLPIGGFAEWHTGTFQGCHLYRYLFMRA